MDNERIGVISESNSNESTEKLSNDKYKFFYYFKEHPAFLVTIVSFALAAVTFLCNYLNNVITRLYLQRWSIDTTLVGPPVRNGTVYYYAIFSLIYFFVYSVLTYRIKQFYSEYFKDLVDLDYLREINKTNNREAKELKRKYRLTKRKLKSGLSYDENMLKEIGDKIDKEIRSIQKTLQSIRNIKKTVVKGMAWKIASFSVLLFIPSVLHQLSFGKTTILGVLVSWAIYSFTFVLAARFLSRRAYRDLSHKRIVSEVKRARTENRLDDFFETIAPSKAQELFHMKKIKDCFSDNNLPTLLVEAMTGLFFMIATVLLTGILLLNTSNWFYTYHSEGKTYAVIYQNENVFYLEEAKEDGGYLIIDPSAQHILKADDLSLIYKKYDKVVRAEDLQKGEIQHNQ